MQAHGQDGVRRGLVIEVARRIDGELGFNMLPRCWVVERIFAWMRRRLVRACERRIDVSKAMIHVAVRNLLRRRMAH